MKAPEKPLDIVTESGEVMATAGYEEAHKHGLRHRSVHMIVLNGKGEVYLTKRAKTKPNFPGYYEGSVAGHADAGETTGQAALRELKEELGVTARPEDLHDLGEFHHDDRLPNGWIENEITTLYLLRYDGKIVVDRREIEDAGFQSKERIMQMINGKEKFTPGFLELFRRCQQLKV